MKIWGAKNLIIGVAMVTLLNLPCYAESLFSTGISENQSYGAIRPRSLYNFGSAKNVGDIVTIEIDETTLGAENTPIDVEKSVSTDIVTEKVVFAGSQTLYFNYISGIEATLKLANAQSVKVIYNGVEYTANTNGNINVKLNDEVAEFQIVNLTENEMELSFTIE